mmetsp:Transcript_36405/g.62039  ORF Transcript_36405/g.62039 Transcript_36405/m.62039 type:complete len:146 (-) Transcript_36405:146-583(-)
MIARQTFLSIAIACLILASTSIAEPTMEHKTKVRARRRARRIAERRTQAQVESKADPEDEFAGRKLEGDPCRDQIDTCFTLGGCMKCKSYTNHVNAVGNVQCLSVSGNEDFLNGVEFEGCCTETDGGTNGVGELCLFWDHPDDVA